MAIQHRRGAYSKFDPSNLVPGEWAVVVSDDPNADDGMAVYICYAAGTVKRMVTEEELAGLSANVAAAIAEMEEVCELMEVATQRALDEVTAAQSAMAGYVTTVGGTVVGTTLVLGPSDGTEAEESAEPEEAAEPEEVEEQEEAEEPAEVTEEEPEEE